MAITEISVSKIYILATEPTNKIKDRFWFDTTSNLLKRYDGTTWKPISVSSDDVVVLSSGNKVSLTSYLNTQIAALAEGIDSKQDKLSYYTEVSGDNPSAIISAANIRLTGKVAEGGGTTASGDYSHAEGYNTTASAYGSHAEGRYTTASSSLQHVQGIYNIEDANNKYADIIGNGSEDHGVSNAQTVSWTGITWSQTDVRAGGTNQDNAIHSLSNKQNKLKTYKEGQGASSLDTTISSLTDEDGIYTGDIIISPADNAQYPGNIILSTGNSGSSGSITLTAGNESGSSATGAASLVLDKSSNGGNITLEAEEVGNITLKSLHGSLNLNVDSIMGLAVDTTISSSSISSHIPTSKAVYDATAALSESKQDKLTFYYEDTSTNQEASIQEANSFSIKHTDKGLILDSNNGGITIKNSNFNTGQAVISIANNSWENSSDQILFDIDGDSIKMTDAFLIPQIKNKQNSTDAALNTTDKTIVGAINGLNTQIDNSSGMLYFTSGSNKYGTGAFSAGEVFSIAYRTDFQFDYASASAGQYRPWSVGNPASSNISVHGLGDDRLRVLYNGGGFCSYKGSNIRSVIKPINDIVVIVANPTGGNINTSLYVNGIQIPQASYSAKPSLEMTGYRLNAMNYASSTIDTTMKDFAIFNFDMSAEGAPYSVADYSAGKPVPPSALAQTAVLLENYTFTVGSTQYIPDVSGNNHDITVASAGTVAGTFDKAIAKLTSLITSTNALPTPITDVKTITTTLENLITDTQYANKPGTILINPNIKNAGAILVGEAITDISKAFPVYTDQPVTIAFKNINDFKVAGNIAGDKFNYIISFGYINTNIVSDNLKITTTNGVYEITPEGDTESETLKISKIS